MEPIVLYGDGKKQWIELRDQLTVMVLNGLTSEHSRRAYRRGLEQFFAWLDANDLALNRESVLAYKNYLGAENPEQEKKKLSPSTINQRLAAIKAFVREAEANRKISSDFASSIEKVKGIRTHGNRQGNWMQLAQVRECLREPDRETLKGKRDFVLLALLFACALRRTELANVRATDIQQREAQWVIPNLIGKGGRTRLVPIPPWVKLAVDEWLQAAGIADGKLIRAVNKADKVWGYGLDPASIWESVADYAAAVGVKPFSPHDARRTCAKLLRKAGGHLEDIQKLLGHSSIVTTMKYVGNDDEIGSPVNSRLELI